MENYRLKKYNFFWRHIEKWEKNFEILRYWNRKTEIHQHKRPISVKNIDINKMVLSNKVSFGKKGMKYFIGWKDAKKIRPLFIFLPKMSVYRKDFNETKYVVLIKDD